MILPRKQFIYDIMARMIAKATVQIFLHLKLLPNSRVTWLKKTVSNILNLWKWQIGIVTVKNTNSLSHPFKSLDAPGLKIRPQKIQYFKTAALSPFKPSLSLYRAISRKKHAYILTSPFGDSIKDTRKDYVSRETWMFFFMYPNHHELCSSSPLWVGYSFWCLHTHK
jgi:hypothetical protein